MDGIIFDIDGTIWDSREQVASSWNAAIAENSSLEIRVDAPLLKTLFGKPMDEIKEIIFPALSPADQDFLAVKCYTYENEYLSKHPAPSYAGVLDTIRALSEKYKLFICSNCQAGYIEVCMKGTGIAPYITDYICFEDTNLPKGENIKLLMQRNHLKDAVYVGDVQGDADAASFAGIPTVFASYGFGTIQNPWATINTFYDLQKIFL